MAEGEPFAGVREAARIDAVDRHRGIGLGKGVGITNQDDERAGVEARANREGELDAIGELDAAQVQFGGADILEFDELELVARE